LVYKEVMDRRALILGGGGGVTGIAWETGVIAGLADLGIDLAAADVIIGTSAGSLAGTDIASGQELEALYQAQLAPPDPEPAARMGWGVIGRLLWVMSTSRDPVRARARIGHWALAARTMPEAGRRKVFEARLPVSDWPAKVLKVTAVDARTGEFVVFDSAGDAGLVDAVGASCRAQAAAGRGAGQHAPRCRTAGPGPMPSHLAASTAAPPCPVRRDLASGRQGRSFAASAATSPGDLQTGHATPTRIRWQQVTSTDSITLSDGIGQEERAPS